MGTTSQSTPDTPERATSSWGYVALALSICAMLAPVFVAFFLFPAALVVTIVAINRKAPRAKWALLPLCIAGFGLIYSSFMVNKAAGDIDRAVQELRSLSK